MQARLERRTRAGARTEVEEVTRVVIDSHHGHFLDHGALALAAFVGVVVEGDLAASTQQLRRFRGVQQDISLSR
jgi:hypothetical protein